MTWEFRPYLIVLAITVVISLAAAAVAWRRRTTAGVMPFTLLMLAVAWWAAMRALEGAAVEPAVKLTFGKLTYFGVASVPVLWLMFALSYCGFQRLLTRRNILLLWVIPLITMLMAVTNDLHHGLWTDIVPQPGLNNELIYQRGWWWYVALIWNYSLIISGALILLWQAVVLRSQFRRQAISLLLAVAIPLTVNFLHFLRIYPIPGLTIDLTPFAFSIAGVILVWGLFQFHLFDLTPFARDWLVDGMDEGVIVLDERNRLVDINPAAQRLLSLPASSIGQPADQIFASWPELLQRCRDVTESQHELRLDSASGEPHHVELRLSLLRNRRGHLVGRLIALHDVTDHKQTEVKLRQLSRAVEQSSASVMITDTSGHIVYVNPSFTRLTGYTPQEVLGCNPNILKSGATPPEEYTRLWQTISAGSEWRGELLNKKKSGELYWEAAIISPIIDSDGQIINYLAVKENITERKRTETELEQSRTHFKAIFDNAAVGIALVDQDGHYLQFNDRWAEMLWYPPDELYQLRDIDLTHLDDWADAEQRLRALSSGEVDYFEVERRYARKDGSVFWGLVSMTAIRSAHGEFQAGLSVVADITERKRVEEIERQRLYESEALRATMTEVLGELELPRLLRALMERLVALLHSNEGELALYDERTGVLETTISFRQGRDYTGMRQMMGEGVMGRVAQMRRTLIVDDYAAWDGRNPRYLEPPQALTILAAPLFSGAQLLGIMEVGADNRHRKFGAQDVRLIETFAQQAAMAIHNASLFEEVHQRARRLELINNISMEISRVVTDLHEVLQASVDGLTQVLGVDQVGLALFDTTRQHLTVQADHPAPGNQSSIGMDLPVEGNLSLQRVLGTRRPLMILDAQHDPLLSHVQAIIIRQKVQSILLVPLIVRETVIGTIGFDVLTVPRSFTQDEIDLAQTVANLVAVRIEQARLLEAERAARRQAQSHAADMRALYAITRATSRSLVVEDVLAQALSSALVALNLEAGVIALFESADVEAQLRLVAERGLSLNVLDWLRTRWLNNIQRSQVFQPSLVRIVDASDKNALPTLREMAEEMEALGWGLCLIIPMFQREQPLGVMCLFARQPQTDVLHDMVLLSSIGQQVATAMTNAQLFQSTMSERSRLKALIEASRDGIILTDDEGRMQVINAQALRLLRLFGKPETWVNITALELIKTLRRITPRAARLIAADMRRLREDTEQAAEGELEVPPHTLHWQSVPVRVGLKPMGRLFVLRDMTEERALEQMREDVTRTMVHDLRNPLSGISAALDMALDGTLGDISSDQRQVLSIAFQSSARMMQLVSAILDVSRLENGRMPIDLRAFSVQELVDAQFMAQTALAAGKNIRLESDIPPSLPPASADVGLIQRVLQNLIGNAIKFTPAGGGVHVDARLEKQAKPPVIWVSISDTGPGVPREIQDRLFQKFVTGSQEERGSGLGLAFCKLAIEAHRQQIWVDSVPGHGATFTFSLAVADLGMMGQ